MHPTSSVNAIPRHSSGLAKQSEPEGDRAKRGLAKPAQRSPVKESTIILQEDWTCKRPKQKARSGNRSQSWNLVGLGFQDFKVQKPKMTKTSGGLGSSGLHSQKPQMTKKPRLVLRPTYRGGSQSWRSGSSCRCHWQRR